MEKGQISQVSIEDLPAEMLQIVLNYLDVSSLLACRLVCRKWNEMFTPILHTRPETELFFFFSSNSKIYLMKGQGPGCKYVEQKKTVVQDFVKCVTQSQNSSSRFRPSPFARFSLINIQKWDRSISKFLSVVSPTVTCLKLSFAPNVVIDVGLIETLRNLLLHETLCLREFGLGFEQKPICCSGFSIPNSRHKHEKVVKLSLFPSPRKKSSREKNQVPASTLLPKLRVLHVGWSFEFAETVGIFRDILKIAPNVEKIQLLVGDYEMDSPYCACYNFDFFLDEGKMNLLKCLEFNPSSYFLSHWKSILEKRKINIKDVSSLFKVEDLKLRFGEEPHIKEVKKTWMAALQLLEQIFEGSKNTLEKINISDTVEFPPGFSFPTLTKLSKIKFQTRDFDQELSPFSMFPPGCRLLNIFPNVKTLDLGNFALYSGLKRFFPREDSIPLMPSVHTILFERVETNEEDVEIMALLCPNVKRIEHVNIHNQDDNGMYDGVVGLEDFPSFGLGVFKNMKNLESLHLITDADAEANSFPALDSTFTGISKEDCLRLFNESTKEDDDPQEKLRRESELKGLKVNESILDLPNLKELNIRIQKGIDFTLIKDDAAYKSCKEKAVSQLTRVSELYAFNLMPGLKYEIIGQVFS